MQYDEQWIIAYAMALEERAKTMVRNAIISSVAIGFIVAAIAGSRLPIIQAAIIWALVTMILGGFLYASATSRATMLRLQAHTALCQVQIERNTRPR